MFAQVVLEGDEAEVGVGGLVEGAGGDAGTVLVGGEGGGALLGVPQVEDARVRGADHRQAGLDVPAATGGGSVTRDYMHSYTHRGVHSRLLDTCTHSRASARTVGRRELEPDMTA